VRTELDPDLPSLYGDWHQLQQMIVNLVTNAQQAIRDSGAQGTITLTTRAVTGARVVLEVRDDGPGIAERDLSRIYDPFFTTKESGRGTGLGLSLVYAIVSSHGGTIQCRSRSGEGTVFAIELPVGSAEAAGAEVAPVTPVAVPGAAPGRILVVDDEQVVARLICEALTADGHRVVQAQDREEALRHAEREEFDLVVVDHKMPGLSDETFGGELERRRPGLGRRMLLVTGDTVSQEPERTARRMGVDLLHKPFDLEDLLRAVRSLLAST
jgi:CheY-like chemotaxis protein